MIPRYTRKEMAAVWEPENRFRKWLDIEIYACEAMSRMGWIPASAVKEIRRRAGFDAARIDEIERTVKHDVIAFLTAVGEKVGPAARYLHWGLTSSDILDTSFAMQLVDASNILESDLRKFLDVLKRRAREHKKTPMIGRTHGMHAEPTTFGIKLALWYAEMQRNLERLGRAKERIAVGKISGAVGTFAHLSPEVEAYVCRKCGLKPAPISSQIIQRDRHAEFFTTLAIIATSIEKIAVEIRHLQRTEVAEAEEPFTAGQKGSSAMPHKRNPVSSENLSGLARLMRGNALASLENMPLWHERDISHSSVERVIGPDSTILLDYMLDRMTRLMDQLVVYPEAMKANLERSRGMVFSEGILLMLVRKGLTREEAYSLVQRAAFESMREKKEFQAVLLADKEILRRLKPAEIREALDLNHTLRNVDKIFARVFKNRTGPKRLH
ncbi:MAG TPA: adenylosuccinate lyase [Thermodesulfobacteriota bacterium]|nr:adenylosuccinate lyase [Thermodesulfobacteriota bacterium]